VSIHGTPLITEHQTPKAEKNVKKKPSEVCSASLPMAAVSRSKSTKLT